MVRMALNDTMSVSIKSVGRDHCQKLMILFTKNSLRLWWWACPRPTTAKKIKKIIKKAKAELLFRGLDSGNGREQDE